MYRFCTLIHLYTILACKKPLFSACNFECLILSLHIYHLFNRICTVHSIEFRPATLFYEITAHGQLHLVPDFAHIGLRKTAQQHDLINIWPLKYETYTDEMLGRFTTPGYRPSECRGKYQYCFSNVYKLSHPFS